MSDGDEGGSPASEGSSRKVQTAEKPTVAGARRRLSGRRRAGRLLLALTGVVAIYYALPVGELPSGSDLVVVTAWVLAGMTALVYVAVRQLRALAHAPDGVSSVRLDVLALAVVVVVPLFALGYYAIVRVDPSQFAELQTKTDALYFATATLATVGYGDVHATGQLARVLVTVQMFFDLVFVAALVSVLGAQLRVRMASKRERPAPEWPAGSERSADDSRTT